MTLRRVTTSPTETKKPLSISGTQRKRFNKMKLSVKRTSDKFVNYHPHFKYSVRSSDSNVDIVVKDRTGTPGPCLSSIRGGPCNHAYTTSPFPLHQFIKSGYSRPRLHRFFSWRNDLQIKQLCIPLCLLLSLLYQDERGSWSNFPSLWLRSLENVLPTTVSEGLPVPDLLLHRLNSVEDCHPSSLSHPTLSGRKGGYKNTKGTGKRGLNLKSFPSVNVSRTLPCLMTVS